MQSQPTAQEAAKRRAPRASDVLREYLKGLTSEHADLVAQREYLQARLELVERQKTNLQEVIDIEDKLAEMERRSPSGSETLSEDPE